MFNLGLDEVLLESLVTLSFMTCATCHDELDITGL